MTETERRRAAAHAALAASIITAPLVAHPWSPDRETGGLQRRRVVPAPNTWFDNVEPLGRVWAIAHPDAASDPVRRAWLARTDDPRAVQWAAEHKRRGSPFYPWINTTHETQEEAQAAVDDRLVQHFSVRLCGAIVTQEHA